MSHMAVELTTPCKIWEGRVDRDGYGRIGKRLAHRVAWIEVNGPIPPGLVVDHRCFRRNCVEVEHLRLLTVSENCSLRRSLLRTHCKWGHEFTPENTYTPPGSIRRRECRRCNADAAARYLARRSA